MTEITYDQFERLIEELKKQTGAIESNASPRRLQIGSPNVARVRKDNEGERHWTHRDNHARRLHDNARDKLNRAISDTAHHLSMLDGEVSELGHAFSGISKLFVGGAIVEEIIRFGRHLVDNYRESISVGQSFNGSLIEMARTAAQAGLPLGEFAAFVKKNSVAMSVYGAKPMAQFALQVRQASNNVGNYGYTVSELNDVSSDYITMQMIYGKKLDLTNSKNLNSLTKGTDQFAKQIATVSGMFGMDRGEVRKQTVETMQNANVSDFIAAHPEKEARIREAIGYIVKLPETLKTYVLNRMVFGGAAIATESGMVLNATGDSTKREALNEYADSVVGSNDPLLPKASKTMAEVYRSAEEDSSNQTVNKLSAVGQNTAEFQARLKYNADLRATPQFQNLQEAHDKAASALPTSTYLSADSVWKEFAGRIKDNLLTPFDASRSQLKPDEAAALGRLRNFTNNEKDPKKRNAVNEKHSKAVADLETTIAERLKAEQNISIKEAKDKAHLAVIQNDATGNFYAIIRKIGDNFERSSKMWAGWITDFISKITPQDIDHISQAINQTVDALVGFSNVVGKIISTVFNFFKSEYDYVKKYFGPTGAAWAVVGTAIAGMFTAKIGGDILTMFLKNWIGQKVGLMKVDAGVVNVNNGKGGGGSGGGGDPASPGDQPGGGAAAKPGEGAKPGSFGRGGKGSLKITSKGLTPEELKAAEDVHLRSVRGITNGPQSKAVTSALEKLANPKSLLKAKDVLKHGGKVGGFLAAALTAHEMLENQKEYEHPTDPSHPMSSSEFHRRQVKAIAGLIGSIGAPALLGMLGAGAGTAAEPGGGTLVGGLVGAAGGLMVSMAGGAGTDFAAGKVYDAIYGRPQDEKAKTFYKGKGTPKATAIPKPQPLPVNPTMPVPVTPSQTLPEVPTWTPISTDTNLASPSSPSKLATGTWDTLMTNWDKFEGSNQLSTDQKHDLLVRSLGEAVITLLKENNDLAKRHLKQKTAPQ